MERGVGAATCGSLTPSLRCSIRLFLSPSMPRRAAPGGAEVGPGSRAGPVPLGSRHLRAAFYRAVVLHKAKGMNNKHCSALLVALAGLTALALLPAGGQDAGKPPPTRPWWAGAYVPPRG